MGRSQKYPVPVNMDGGVLLPSHSGSLTLARTHVIGMDVSPYIPGHDHEHVLESEKMSPLGSQDMTTVISDAKCSIKRRRWWQELIYRSFHESRV
jgi:hypothetical protein